MRRLNKSFGLKPVLALIFIVGGMMSANAHEFAGSEVKGKATYLANEGVVVESGGSKLMFDPFFHNDYGVYALVPEKMRQAIFAGKAPFDKIDAVFVSHAHEDHFDAADMIKYLTQNSAVQLFAPNQAVEQLKSQKGFADVQARVNAILLAKDEKAKQIPYKNLLVEAVRIPHAGWPQRADVENIVFRVGGQKTVRVMHMGDADPDEEHYKPHQKFWHSHRTDMVFAPYWFGLMPSGQKILQEVINAEKAVGVHVPTALPKPLQNTTFDFFHQSGETREITKASEKN